MIGFQTLFYKELLRFWKVSAQTIIAPVVTALLYLLIFGNVLSDHVSIYHDVSYSAFLIPGLIMMSILQNAFANTSSSLIQSKVMGNLIFILLTPLSYWEFFLAYVAAAVVRGLVVGGVLLLVTLIFIDIPYAAPIWIVVFALLGATLLGTLGVVAGIWAEKYDGLAAFQNFLIVPATFLAGVFYSLHALPHFWLVVSYFNPFFYMIDGFRYGFLGQSDVSPWMSLAVVLSFLLGLSGVVLAMLKSGYKLRT